MAAFCFFANECTRILGHNELSFVFYGLSAFVMWLRTLHFVLVQQSLGQVPCTRAEMNYTARKQAASDTDFCLHDCWMPYGCKPVNFTQSPYVRIHNR